MASKLLVPLQSETSVSIVKQSRSVLYDILQTKFGCVATIDGLDFSSGSAIAQQKRPAVDPEKRVSFVLGSGVEVSVWKADLTDFSVDAVVNAANERLKHGGGLAYALSVAGGSQIQQESDDYIMKHGQLETGDAVMCGPGLLKSKALIHAVGPYLSNSSDLTLATHLLEKTVKSILDIVKDKRLNTVAIPAISSGLFNFPLPQCAKTIVSAVKRYYEKTSPRGHLPKEICLVNIDEPTVREMEKACHQILTPPPYQQHAVSSQVASKQTRSADKTSTPSVQIKNVLLILKKDRIEDQKTDVIVNTASPCRDLNIGKISSALLEKAGQGMQKEIKQARRDKNIIATASYGLSSKQVYHTFCPEKGKSSAHQALFDSVLECLQLAAKKNHKSIAFPAIGTGALGFTKSESAMVMTEAVLNFAHNCQSRMEVHFVIYPSDHDTFQAFEENIMSLQQKSSQSGFRAGQKNNEDFQSTRASVPQITLNGPSDESVQEAEKWLCDLFNLSDHMVIQNNFIQHFSEKQYMQLSGLGKNGVTMEVFLTQGHACIDVDGQSAVDVAVTVLQVEAMLCKIQDEFLKEEKSELELMSTKVLSFERKTLHLSSPEFKDKVPAFSKEGLWVLKVEKVENSSLKLLFDLKKKQLCCTNTKKMFQLIPAQFCDMVSHIGFRAEFAPPESSEYGEGIYFAGTVKKAMEVWKEKNNKYKYFVEAEVLTGNSTRGKPGLILPPAMGKDPQKLYDSVDGGPDISVIFTGYQALPKYIITCLIV
ncbi:protein mono-ADP-ribosyltransferase PARP9 [Parambassis ranga]|uniref:Protein mono-ADP-ribosyltransferase PARP9 n=1 Tax=Parambassis ranga TaxID=210632 RepID=A0A6P7KIV4_9TELE|nr:protein mono-ADP-ribosyltransferase PARP9 [Parambassis ranga]